MYVGKLWRGVIVNLAVVASLIAFVGLFVVLEFFPVLPLLVLVAGWLLVSSLIVRDIWADVDAREETYELKGYNHWTVYSVVFLLAYVLPLAATLGAANAYVWELHEVETRAMYPSLEPGDTVLVKKTTVRSRPTDMAELVALEAPGTDRQRILRVIASGADNSESTVRLAGDSLYVDDERLTQVPFDTRVASAAGNTTPEYELWVEHNHDDAYLVSLRPSMIDKPTYTQTTLENDQLYLLADNRSFSNDDGDSDSAVDSRDFGPVGRDNLTGTPLYVAWSTSPSSGEIRWNRIGLRLQ